MDPIAIIGSCISVAKAIYSLKQEIESDDDGCVRFFSRIEGIAGPLEEIQSMSTDALNSRAVSLQQILETLRTIDDLLTKRVRNKKTWFGLLKNAKDTKLGNFSGVLAELNVQLDRCIASLQLAITVDFGTAIHKDTQSIRASTNVIAESVSASAKTTEEIRDDTSAIRSQLDLIAQALQQQTLNASIETQFVKDPKPEDEDDDRSVLGQGAFGVTHRMINTVDKAVYAVKQVKVKQALASGLKMEDLQQEARTLQQLNHPHIVRYFTSYFSKKDTIFNVVMELITGGALAERITDPTVTVNIIGRWLSQMASTLVYLHCDMRTQHRDIKPENILLTNDGRRIKLIDLGTASVMKTVATKMSRVGTSTYFSYEKANDIPYDGRDDVWAAGCVFAELLTKSRLSDRGGGIHLYTNPTVNERRVQLIAECVTVDGRLGSAVGRMLEAQQEKRCTSEELVQILQGGAVVAATATTSADVQSANVDVAYVAPTSVFRSNTSLSQNDVVKLNPSPATKAANIYDCFVSAAAAVGESEGSLWRQTSSFPFFTLVYTVSLSPDCTKVAVGGNTSSVYVYSLINREQSPLIIPNVTPEWVHCLCFSPDSKLLAAGNRDKTVKVFNASTGALLTTAAMKGMVHWVLFTPNGSQMIAGDGLNDYSIVNTATGAVVSRHKVGGKEGGSLSKDGKVLVVASSSRMTVIDDLTRVRLPIMCQSLSCFVVSGDGGVVVAGFKSGEVKHYSTVNGQTLKSFTAHDSEVSAVCLSLDGLSLLTGSKDKTIKVWNAQSCESTQLLDGHTGTISGVRFGNSRLIVSGSLDATARVWEI